MRSMKIFKNGVGRPSNATIRKRRIICFSFAATIAIFIGLIVINSDKLFNLKGATTKATVTIAANCDSINGQDKCKVIYSLRNTKDVKSVKTRIGTSSLKSGKIKGETLNNVKVSQKLFTVVVYYKDGTTMTKQVKLKQNGYNGRAYYYDQYDYQTTPYCGRTLQAARDGCARGNSICSSGCAGTSIAIALSTMTQNSKYNPVFISETLAKLPNSYSYCGFDGTSSNGIKAVIKHLGFNIKRMTNEKGDSEYKLKNTIINEVKKALSNGGQVIINSYEPGSAAGCFASAGHFMAIVGINDKQDKIYLYDPNRGDNNDQNGKVRSNSGCKLSGQKNNWWKINEFFAPGGISSSGNFTVYIVTKKTSSNVVTTKKTTTKKTAKPVNTTAKKNSFSFFCPTGAIVNSEITCFTDKSDITIAVAEEGKKYLLNNYSASFTTKGSDKTKQMSFSKPGIYKVTAKSSSGVIQTKQIKVVEKTYKASKLLVCPDIAYINKEFSCFTNKAGVKFTIVRVSGSGSMADSFSSSYITKASDLTKQIRWTATGKIKVCAELDKNKVCKTISIVKY